MGVSITHSFITRYFVVLVPLVRMISFCVCVFSFSWKWIQSVTKTVYRGDMTHKGIKIEKRRNIQDQKHKTKKRNIRCVFDLPITIHSVKFMEMVINGPVYSNSEWKAADSFVVFTERWCMHLMLSVEFE